MINLLSQLENKLKFSPKMYDYFFSKSLYPPSTLLPLLHDVSSDGCSSIVLGWSPFQLHEVLVPVTWLWTSRFAGLVCESLSDSDVFLHIEKFK